MQLSKRVKQKLELNTGERIPRLSVQQIMIIAGALLSALGYAVFNICRSG